VRQGGNATSGALGTSLKLFWTHQNGGSFANQAASELCRPLTGAAGNKKTRFIQIFDRRVFKRRPGSYSTCDSFALTSKIRRGFWAKAP
jgi:hypothetical protein